MNKLNRFLTVFATLALTISPNNAHAVIWTGDSVWVVGINDTTDGGVQALANQNSPLGWWNAGAKETWGTGYIHSPAYNGPWFTGKTAGFKQTGPSSFETIYQTPVLKIVVERSLNADNEFLESYTFTNTGTVNFHLADDAVGIYTPLNDTYQDVVQTTVKSDCDVHVWAGGGSSSWIDAVRMGGTPPRFGLVLTQGALSSYSQVGVAGNDRGLFVLHPGPAELKPGESYSVSWKIFQHQNWDDFFAKALQVSGFVRLQARNYTVVQGQPLELTADSADSLEGAQVLTNGAPVSAKIFGTTLTASPIMQTLGEQKVELVRADGRRAILNAWVSPDPYDLIQKRVEFIIRNQQVNKAGDPADGGFAAYDNQTGALVGAASTSAGLAQSLSEERICMGLLIAKYLGQCQDTKLKDEITASLQKYLAFYARELQDPEGKVYDQPGYIGQRMYNYPWVAQLHLEAYRATGDKKELEHFVQTCRAYYGVGGAKFYCIGMPILEGLEVLQKAGANDEYQELLGLFRAHADQVLLNGTDYPHHEVKFEQSIVGPAAQILLEFYLATHEQKYLDGAKIQMKVLESFNGRQPDHHLNEIAIRYWDDYWSGKGHIFGDTFPQDWSAITGVVYDEYAQATGDKSYEARATQALQNNWCLFTPDGHASCAYVYPLTVNAKAAQFYDGWANDNDFALLYWLQVQARAHEKTP